MDLTKAHSWSESELGQSRSSDSNPGLSDSKAWMISTELTPTWLLTCYFLDCFAAEVLSFNKTINSTSTRTMSLISFEHRTRPWVDVKKCLPSVW